MAGEYKQAVSSKQFTAQLAVNTQINAQSKTMMAQMSQAMAESKKGNKINFNK